jgi:DNA-binding NtrC family response regulator
MGRPYLGRVLIVEDDKDMSALLKSSLEYDGFQCSESVNSSEARNLIHQFSFDAVLLDLNLGDESGLEIIPEIARTSPFTKIIVMTAFGSIDLAVDAMERGATTFITKSDDPSRITEELRKRVNANPSFETTGEKSDINSVLGIIGKGKAMSDLLEEVDQIKDVDATVLLLGESGTGKELIARAIHHLSERNGLPFEALNCGAIPENLLESELFGYKKGSFTDAKTDRKGVFEVCSHGTLFLDEIGEMPLSLQVKLLRVLQEKEIKPIGASQSQKVETRVICATNKDLEREVKEGRFREDLYFRLSVFPIHLPALRKRKEDIQALVEFFISKFNDRYKRSVNYPSKEIMSRISTYEWPGNIRELQNSIERAVVLSKDGEIHLESMFVKNKMAENGKDEGSTDLDTVVYTEAKEYFERSFLKKILSATRGNISEAARISGRFRSDIYRLIEKYGIDQEEFR